MVKIDANTGLTNTDLLALLKKEEVCITLSNDKVILIQKNWDKYQKYWESKSNQPGSLLTAAKGIIWLFHRAYLYKKYPDLHALISLYCESGHLLEPVQFKKISDNEQKLYLRSK